MADEPRESSSISDDPVSYMLSVAIELHEMKKALVDSGFTDKEALYLVGQAVAAGVMLPVVDFGPEDFPPIADFPDDDDDGNLL
jgi:hypothetical protein